MLIITTMRSRAVAAAGCASAAIATRESARTVNRKRACRATCFMVTLAGECRATLRRRECACRWSHTHQRTTDNEPRTTAKPSPLHRFHAAHDLRQLGRDLAL